MIATTLPPEEIEGIRQMFIDMDADGSGTISFEELREGLRKKGAHVADSELQRIMAEVRGGMTGQNGCSGWVDCLIWVVNSVYGPQMICTADLRFSLCLGPLMKD